MRRRLLRTSFHDSGERIALGEDRRHEDLVGRIAECVEEGVRKGEIGEGPTDLRMLVLMGSLGEALCGYVLTGRPELTAELADALVATILGSWYAR